MTNETYNGWTNWDTWECFNILTNDEYLYRESRKWSHKPKMLRALVNDWLIENEMPFDHIDFDEVNFDEIEKALCE